MLNPRRMQPARLIVWVILTVLAAWLVFIGGGAMGTLDPRLRMTSLGLAGMVIAVWTFVALRDPSWRPRSVLMAPIALALAAFAAATLFAPQVRLGMEYLGYACLLASLYLLLVRLVGHPWFLPRVMALTTMLAVLIGVLYIAIVLMRWIEWWSLVGTITTPPLRPGFEGMTWANPSAVLAMSVLLTVPAVAWIGWETGTRRLATSGLVALALVVALLTGSRAGWLALAVAGALAAAWIASHQDVRALVAAALRSPAVRIGAFVAGSFAILASVALLPAVLFRTATGGGDVRGAFVDAALGMFADHPISGVGPGGWAANRIAYTSAEQRDYYIPHAHNLPAQILAEFGIVGVIAGAIALWFLGRLVIGAMRDPTASRRRLGWLAWIGIAYFATHQLFDLYVNLPAVLFAFAIPIAWLDATSAHAARPLPGRVVAAAALVSLLVIGALWLAEQPAATMADAVTHANRGDWQEADRLAQEGLRQDPEMPAYQLIAGVAAARVGDDVRAAAAFRRAAESDDLPTSWLGLAAASAGMGDHDEARRLIPRALRLGIQQPAIAMAAGELLLRLGDDDGATEAFAAAIRMTPSLAGDPWWTSRSDVAALWPRILADVGAASSFEISLVTGSPQRARELVGGLPGDQRTRYVEIVDAWEGDPGALERLRAAIRASPLDLSLLAWVARIESRAGNTEEAARYRAWSETVNGLSSLMAAELRVDQPPTRPVDIAGTQTNFFGLYTYRRATPWDLLHPDLLHLTLE